MQDLIAALAEAQRKLESGDLDHAGLELACQNARELYERLIVLRHRSREMQLAPQAATAKPDKTNVRSSVDARDLDLLPDVKEPPPIRLDTRPQEVSPRQTSLIEAIEETQSGKEAKRPEPVKDNGNTLHKDGPGTPPIKKADPAPSLAEKLTKAQIGSLAKSISLSHKFWFVSELFGGDRIAYEKSIMALDGMQDRDQAEVFLQTEVLAKLKKPADPEALITIRDLIERRFP